MNQTIQLEKQRSLTDKVAVLLEKYPQYVFPAPAVILIVLLMIFPVAYTVYLSFNYWTGGLLRGPEWIFLDNYIRMFQDPRFLNSILKMAIIALSATLLEAVIGVALALFFNREFVGRGLVRTIFLFPMIATPSAIAMIWKLMFNPSSGLFNYLLSLLHIAPQAWLADRQLALVGIIVVDVWQWSPFIMLITLAALTALPKEPFESALIDGANNRQILIYLTLPLIRPAIMIGVLFRVIDVLKLFDTIYVLTQGGPGDATETLNIYAFRTSFEYSNVGYGSAMLVFFYLILLATVFIFLRFRRARWQ